MPTQKSTFHGKFMYYENVNGKEKKLEKEFKDKKQFDDFTKKFPIPSLGEFLGLKTSKLPLVSKTNKKMPCSCCKPAPKKPVAAKKPAPKKATTVKKPVAKKK